ncbi:glycine cleavage system protein GcvH [Photobacterium sp. 1_MG-2023]|uniref:glycine cleavage system protein GcvH n=1 Tax=Photobacterium sp. 1_MG-2023 TaxID=3062646 RepID=UPI0026E4816F|nr:glycine cleavage system protein GcvH [Photobacterium sp. 1_MG-2023]MDO6708035.1 glycine cleavage system protein GcvH [Photobacterium sp. 1_MG-2023]
MADTPSDLKYAHTHEWIRAEGGGVYTVGISDQAQQLLGDMVFVELPEVGSTYSLGDACGSAESVKAVSEVYAPLSGEVVAINEELEMEPELVNSDPYGDGWMFQLKADDEAELDELLDAEAYIAVTNEEDD